VNRKEVIERLKKPDNAPENFSGRKVSESDDLDQEYNDLSKKHRILIARFNNFYELVSHPFVIIILSCILIAVFVVFRYLEIFYPDNLVFTQIHKDMKTLMPFFVTIIVTVIVTKYLEKRKRNPGK